MAVNAVIFHSQGQARTAASVAAELDVPVTLVSSPGAARILGPGWFREIVARIRGEVPQARLSAYLDCADYPGDVLEAFRAPVPGVIFTGAAEAAARLREMAEARGITFLDSRPAALDLLDSRDPEELCRSWFLSR